MNRQSAAQSQPVEDAPCISRSISGPFYLYCLAGAAWRGGSGTDQMMTHSTAGRAVGNVNRRRHVYWLNGGWRTGRSLRTQKVILLARGTCGIGFIGLCVNALLPEPSLLAIYLLGLWDGFSRLWA